MKIISLGEFEYLGFVAFQTVSFVCVSSAMAQDIKVISSPNLM